jgi:hypothetical protein
MSAELIWIESSHAIKSRCDVVVVKPAFVPPSETNEEAVEGCRSKMAFGEGEKFASSCESTRFSGVPTEMGETSSQGIGGLNRSRWREPGRHEHPIPINEVGVLAGSIPVLWRRQHKSREVGAHHWIDSIPELNGSVADRDQAVGAEKSTLEVMMERDGVKHPRLAGDCHVLHSLRRPGTVSRRSAPRARMVSEENRVPRAVNRVPERSLALEPPRSIPSRRRRQCRELDPEG